MTKLFKHVSRFLITLLAFSLACGSLFASVSSAKQLEKAKQLYAENREDEAMDLFIDVLVSGSRTEVEEANRYINVIHNHMGGIQTPVKVDVNFKEGETVRMQGVPTASSLEQQIAVEGKNLQQELRQAGSVAAEQAEEGAVIAQQQAYSLTSDAEALYLQQQNQFVQQYAPQVQQTTTTIHTWEQAVDGATEASVNGTVYEDLTSPAALQVRQLYTEQKLASMQQAAIDKLERTPGVRVYFRNDLVDAIDVDSEVLFNGYKFRPEASEVLDQIYTLMALNQGAGYIILPPGSYTDNITLPGIRQAMALNSYLVHRGLSSGKITYNMGLFDEEPPAKFANLEGLSIVFDYEANLPASLPEATAVNDLPMLSMAVVPVSNKIDPSAGEAFAIDFSVIETANTIDSWVFQVVQHAADGQYYIVRQLDGFAPVYHQFLWNGRKGVIGPMLACGKYTLVLTAKDTMGGKSTLRRQVEVECVGYGEKVEKTSKALNYKSARLWTKPGRIMRTVGVTEVYTPEVTEPEVVDPFAVSNTGSHTETLHETSYTELPDGSIESRTTTTTTTTSGGSMAQGVVTGTTAPESIPNIPQDNASGVTNPYDMPYEEYGNY